MTTQNGNVSEADRASLLLSDAGSTRASEFATLPLRGDEASWSFPDGAIHPMPNFGGRPASVPYRDPDRLSRIRDAIVAAVIVLVLVSLAGLYVSGVFGHNASKSPPSQPRDPFAVTGSGRNP